MMMQLCGKASKMPGSLSKTKQVGRSSDFGRNGAIGDQADAATMSATGTRPSVCIQPIGYVPNAALPAANIFCTSASLPVQRRNDSAAW